MSSLIVAKFGGTSMATANSFGVVGRRVERNQDMRVIVVSAPGKINDRNDPERQAGRDPVKVTDRLLSIARKARTGEPLEEDIGCLERRYASIEDGAGMGDGGRISPSIRKKIMERCGMLGDDDAPVAALGEEFNSRLFASYLTVMGVRTAYLNPVDAGFTVSMSNGKVTIEEEQFGAIRSKVQAVLDRGERIVFPGFFGHDREGKIRTFPRGGSDYTGSVLAAALGAGLYQNFTDTDGIRAVEPSIAADAPVIRRMTHRELTELTLGGKFGVFQYEAAVPLAISGVVTQVLDTFDPSSEGTYVMPQVGAREREITGIVHRGEFLAFEIVKYGTANAVGFFSSVLEVFSGMGISVEHAPSSTNDISVIVRKESMSDAGAESADVAAKLREVIRPHDLKIDSLSAVTVVGEDVSRVPGLGKRIFEAVNDAGVNVPYHSHQGISFTLWLRNGGAEKAAKAIYASQIATSA